MENIKYAEEKMRTYGNIVSGKRRPEILGLSPRLDPDDDGITTSLERGLIYKRVGPDGHKDFSPLGNNIIGILKVVIIVSLISIATSGAWSGSMGCLASYIELNWGWTTQFVIFLSILINIFILSAESAKAVHEITWTGYSIIAAFITWILLNMIAKIDDTWFFFDVPFYPGPITYWGAAMLLACVIFIIDRHKTYLQKYANVIDEEKPESGGKPSKTKLSTRINIFVQVEFLLILLLMGIIGYRFVAEYQKEKKRLKRHFNFISFFTGLNTPDKHIISYTPQIDEEGRCILKSRKKIAKEIDRGIKNSPWYKFKKKIVNML